MDNPYKWIKASKKLKVNAPIMKEMYLKLSKGEGSDVDKLTYISAYEDCGDALDTLGEASISGGFAAKLILKQVTQQMIYYGDKRFKDLYNKCKDETNDNLK